jgi:hypothetical protein
VFTARYELNLSIQLRFVFVFTGWKQYTSPLRNQLCVLLKLSVYSHLNSLQRMRHIQLYFAAEPAGRVLCCWQRRVVSWVVSSDHGERYVIVAVCRWFYFYNKKLLILYCYLCCQKTAELPVGLVVETASGRGGLQGDVMSKIVRFGGVYIWLYWGMRRDGNKLLSFAG